MIHSLFPGPDNPSNERHKRERYADGPVYPEVLREDRALKGVCSIGKGASQRSAATKVPLRKTTVTAANVLITDESSLFADAKVLVSSATAMLTFASFWAMRLKSQGVLRQKMLQRENQQ